MDLISCSHEVRPTKPVKSHFTFCAVQWFNLMWYFLLGISTALDTLGSQAYGANDRPGVIAWSTAAATVMSVIGVPMAVALYYAKGVARTFFGQSEELAEVSGSGPPLLLEKPSFPAIQGGSGRVTYLSRPW